PSSTTRTIPTSGPPESLPPTCSTVPLPLSKPIAHRTAIQAPHRAGPNPAALSPLGRPAEMPGTSPPLAAPAALETELADPRRRPPQSRLLPTDCSGFGPPTHIGPLP